jgi:hypothetical protein
MILLHPAHTVNSDESGEREPFPAGEQPSAVLSPPGRDQRHDGFV